MLRRIVETFVLGCVLVGTGTSLADDLPPPQMPATMPLEIPPQLPPPTIVAAPKLWTGSVDIGMTGTEGNSQNFNFTAATKGKRDTQDQTFTFESLYAFSTADSKRTQNRFFNQARNEWKFSDSPWSVFLDGSLEYDEFWAFDVRVASHVGMAYQFIKSEMTSLKGRMGVGVSRQIGGDYENRLFPELLVGMDFEQKLTDRTKFTSSVDVFPDIGDFSNYRAQSSVALEWMIDPVSCMAFKIGALDRYNSVTQGKKRNDLNYFASLGWKF